MPGPIRHIFFNFGFGPSLQFFFFGEFGLIIRHKNVGIWMIMHGVAYETSSGGPFMRDINSQSGDDQELYWYMNSGHVRTEPWRFGLMGPYAMKFT